MNDKLFTLRIGLTNREHGNKVLAVVAYDRPSPPNNETGHSYIDIRARLMWTDANGKRRTKTIFRRGETWCGVNRWTSTDGDDAKELVISTLAMKPGDTDAEYFAGYKPHQLAFAEEYGDTLSCIALDRYGER